MMEQGETAIPCHLKGCTGTYERREVLHCFELEEGPVCIDHIPALVCNVCGDRQFDGETVERLQQLIRERREPDKHLPAYEFNRAGLAKQD